MEKPLDFAKGLLLEKDGVIYFTAKSEFKNAEEYIAFLRLNGATVRFFEEEVIALLDFEAIYGKTIKVAIVNGMLFDGKYTSVGGTIDFAEKIGLVAPRKEIICLLYAKLLEKNPLLSHFSIFVVIHKELLDPENFPFMVSIDCRHVEPMHNYYYDEPLPGLYAKSGDAYVFEQP